MNINKSIFPLDRHEQLNIYSKPNCKITKWEVHNGTRNSPFETSYEKYTMAQGQNPAL